MHHSEVRKGSLLFIVKVMKQKTCTAKDGELETFGKYTDDYCGSRSKEAPHPRQVPYESAKTKGRQGKGQVGKKGLLLTAWSLAGHC